jgi:hypothetical protein
VTAPIKVFVLQYTHRHGEDFSAYGTRQDAEIAAARIAHEYARELPTGADAAKVRALYDSDQFIECVAHYILCCDAESLDIHELEVRS